MLRLSGFQKTIYDICKSLGATVGRFHEAGVTPNFHACDIELRYGDCLVILCSIHDDWALAKAFDLSTGKLEFIDHDELARVFNKSYGIKILPKEILDGPFMKKSYMHQSDIDYWRPQTLGEGLFNWWD